MTIETTADEAFVSGPYVVADSWGCCAEQQSHEVFSLYTGKKLFSATGAGDFGDWLTMGKKGPNYQQRIVAAHLAFTARDAAELGEDKSVVGVITYATEAEPLQRLALRARGGRDGDLGRGRDTLPGQCVDPAAGDEHPARAGQEGNHGRTSARNDSRRSATRRRMSPSAR